MFGAMISSMATTIPYRDVIDVICQHCHNDETAPSDLIPQAEATLKWLRLIRMHLRSLEDDNKGDLSAGDIEELESEYHRLSHIWHRFDLANTDKAAEELLVALEKAIDQ